MPNIETSLAFHLTQYFTGQTVIIRIDGKEVARNLDTRTDMRTDVARILNCKVTSAPIVVQVEVPEVSASADVTLVPADIQFVVVSLDGARLQVEPVSKSDYEREPRGYA